MTTEERDLIAALRKELIAKGVDVRRSDEDLWECMEMVGQRAMRSSLGVDGFAKAFAEGLVSSAKQA